MTLVKPALSGLILLLVASQAHAEYRTVFVQVKHDKDNKLSVAIFSDVKAERTSSATVEEAVKALGAMRGWGSQVGVYITADRSVAPAVRNQLLAAIDNNVWLQLEQFGGEVPRRLREQFLGVAPATDAEGKWLPYMDRHVSEGPKVKGELFDKIHSPMTLGELADLLGKGSLPIKTSGVGMIRWQSDDGRDFSAIPFGFGRDAVVAADGGHNSVGTMTMSKTVGRDAKPVPIPRKAAKGTKPKDK